MQQIIQQIENEVLAAFLKLSSSDFSDEGISGLHLQTNPILIPGVRIEKDQLDTVQRKINQYLRSSPIKVKLTDRKSISIFGIDLSVTQSSKVYLNDVIDGSIA